MRFFRGVPENPGFAVIIVTHLSPERKSYLLEIVSRFSGMTVLAGDVEGPAAAAETFDEISSVVSLLFERPAS